MPFGLKIEDLKRDHLSRPRNPLIAEVFYRRGPIERWGRGTQKIVELCLQAGHPEPEFVEQAGAVGVRFLPSGYIAPHRIAHDLTVRQRRILQTLPGSKEVSFGDLRVLVAPGVAVRTFRDDLLHLKMRSAAGRKRKTARRAACSRSSPRDCGRIAAARAQGGLGHSLKSLTARKETDIVS